MKGNTKALKAHISLNVKATIKSYDKKHRILSKTFWYRTFKSS